MQNLNQTQGFGQAAAMVAITAPDRLKMPLQLQTSRAFRFYDGLIVARSTPVDMRQNGIKSTSVDNESRSTRFLPEVTSEQKAISIRSYE